MKRRTRNLIVAGAAACILAAAFFLGGNPAGPGEAAPRASASAFASSGPAFSAAPEAAPSETSSGASVSQPSSVQAGAPSSPACAPSPSAQVSETAAPPPSGGQVSHPPASEPSGTPSPGQKQNTCSLSVTCGALLDNMDRLDPAKAVLVPADGVLFEARDIAFEEGDTVFGLLRRELRDNGIHMEFTGTSVSAYIEGIGNLYEFDCGDLSGWTYRVNGSVPGVSCGEYALSPGDSVEWLYTCDLGRDLGTGVSP